MVYMYGTSLMRGGRSHVSHLSWSQSVAAGSAGIASSAIIRTQWSIAKHTELLEVSPPILRRQVVGLSGFLQIDFLEENSGPVRALLQGE